jgi:hypothetical protein
MACSPFAKRTLTSKTGFFFFLVSTGITGLIMLKSTIRFLSESFNAAFKKPINAIFDSGVSAVKIRFAT